MKPNYHTLIHLFLPKFITDVRLQDVVYCSECEGKYHKACISSDVNLEDIEEEWTCPTCIDLALAGLRSPATSAQKEAKESSGPPSEEDVDSQESTAPHQGSQSGTGDVDVDFELQSDHSLTKRKRDRPPKQPSSDVEPIKRKRGRPPKQINEPLQNEDDVDSSNSHNQIILKKKRGRPPKQKDDESYNLKPPKKKRGRPPKAKGEITVAGDDFEPPKRKRGRPPKLRSDDDAETRKNDRQLLPKRKRGRPPKQEKGARFGGVGVVQAYDNNRPAAHSIIDKMELVSNDGKPEKNSSSLKGPEVVVKGFEDETNSQFSYLSKSSTHSASAAKGQQRSNSLHSPRRSSRPSKHNSLFYESEEGERLEEDTFSQISNVSRSSASASAVLKQGGLMPAPRRSGRPCKPNSLLYELGDGEQHLRSSKYAAEVDRKATVTGQSDDQKKCKTVWAKAQGSPMSNVAENDIRRGETPGEGAAHLFPQHVFAEAGEEALLYSQKIPSAKGADSVPSVFNSSTATGVDLSYMNPPGMSHAFEMESFKASGVSPAQQPATMATAASSATPVKTSMHRSPEKTYVDMRLQQRSFVEEHVSSTKQPRRKPGARECMQISRRFHTQVIPQRYMDTLLDYVNRGKIEHLVRMRERLDEHSRMLESQLAGLEALVREKGEYQPGKSDSS